MREGHIAALSLHQRTHLDAECCQPRIMGPVVSYTRLRSLIGPNGFLIIGMITEVVARPHFVRYLSDTINLHSICRLESF